MNLTTVLAKISPFLWKKTLVDSEKAFFFDMRKADQETLEYFQDTMDGLEPEELNLQYVIPVGVVGAPVGVDVDASEYREGKFRWGQFSSILFVNVKEAKGDKAPVYSIDVDGNIVPETYKKVANDLSELDIRLA